MIDTILRYEDFEPFEGNEFTVVHDGDLAIILTLTEVKRLKIHASAPADARPPFSLLFQSTFQEVMPQQLYRLRHDSMGEVEIFLVPTAQVDAGIQYLATFN